MYIPKAKIFMDKYGLTLSLLLVLGIAGFVFSLFGFRGQLTRDNAIYFYMGQQMADGNPPYKSVFDHKGPVAPVLAGIGVMVANQFSIDDIFAVRLLFFLFGVATIGALFYLTFELFESQKFAFLSSFIFINFWGFGWQAASGPQAKVPMVFFQIMSLWLTARRNWFLSGFMGSLAFLTWQPMAIFPFITFLLAIFQSSTSRQKIENSLKVLGGILIPIIIFCVYFIWQNALWDFLDGYLFFNVSYLERELPVRKGEIISPYSLMLLILVSKIQSLSMDGILKTHFKLWPAWRATRNIP